MQQRVVLLAPPPKQVAADHMAPICVTDLSTAFHDEPRIHDLLLAERLGFKRFTDIRELIKRNKFELETYGTLASQQSNVARGVSGTLPHGTVKSRMGRPTTEYWLNEGQALLICALARTTSAARIRRELITVFMAVRHGNPMPVVHVAPQVGELEAMHQTVAKMRAEVNTLNRKLGSLLAVVEDQGRALAYTSKKAAVKLVQDRVVAGPITPPAALLYGAEAIATNLNLRPSQVRSMIAMGRIPASKLGGRICCTTEMLDTWMAAMGMPGKDVRS